MTELTDRMRTCAAYLASKAIDDLPNEVFEEAARLLVEAADELEKPIEVRLGTPMEPIPPSEAARVAPEETVPHRPAASGPPGAMWYGEEILPVARALRGPCPACDSRTHKTVRAIGGKLELECPVCGARWQR